VYFGSPYEAQFPTLFDGSLDVRRVSKVRRGPATPMMTNEHWRPPTLHERLIELGHTLLGGSTFPSDLMADEDTYEFRSMQGERGG